MCPELDKSHPDCEAHGSECKCWLQAEALLVQPRWKSPRRGLSITELGNRVCRTHFFSRANFFTVEVANIVELCMKDSFCALYCDLPHCHCLYLHCSSYQHNGLWRLSFFIRLKQQGREKAWRKADFPLVEEHGRRDH